MDVATIIFIILLLLLLASLIEPLANRLHLPFSAALVLTGFIGSELLVRNGIDTGLRWHHFHTIIFYIALPILIFSSAFTLKTKQLRQHSLLLFLLAIPVVMFSMILLSVFIYWGIGHDIGFPWRAALLTSTLLVATDPSAVINYLYASRYALHAMILETESLFNDVSAIVMFTALLQLALMPEQNIDLSTELFKFFINIMGGLAVGAGVAVLSYYLFKHRWFTGYTTVHALFTLIAAYSSFFIANRLQVSGTLAILIVGLVLGHTCTQLADKAHLFIKNLWAFNAYIANALIFLLVGVTINIAMFTSQWLAMLIGIGAVLAARIISITCIQIFFKTCTKRQPPYTEYAPFLLTWGGLRGTVAVALALSLPTELSYWWTIQSMIYGVVLSSLLLQSPSLSLFLHYTKQDKNKN